MARSTSPNRSSLLAASLSPRSADLAGRAVRLSPDIPASFDARLAAHHRIIGRWVAFHETVARPQSRPEARHDIEAVFARAVAGILGPFDLVDLRVVILDAQGDHPPAATIVCDSQGQLDLGWIEDGDQPTPWRAAAYQAIGDSLGHILPTIRYDDLIEEISMYYWEGGTTDEEARAAQIALHGMDPDDIDEDMLPSAMDGRRPSWMRPENIGIARLLPADLRKALLELRLARRAARRLGDEHAWTIDRETVLTYLPENEDHSWLPPLTIVPFEAFARELDDITRTGMEMGFQDIAGICPLTDTASVERWLEALRTGARLLLAVQSLIRLYPLEPRDPQ
ncbi:hypothetical protein [Sphingomonas oryzagri]